MPLRQATFVRYRRSAGQAIQACVGITLYALIVLNTVCRYIHICTYLPKKVIVLCYLDDGSNWVRVGANSLRTPLIQFTIYTCLENTGIISYCETSD